MKRHSFTLSALAVAVASPALADISAADLWAEWQVLAEANGQTVAADVTDTANGLALNNFTLTYEDENASMLGAIEQVSMVENADGTVSVTYSEVYSMTFSFEVEEGAPPGNIELNIRQENLNMEVSGDVGARSYAYTADRITLSEGDIWGGDGPPPEIDLNMVFTDINAVYGLFGTDPDQMRFTSSGTMGSMTMIAEITPPPPEEGTVKAGLMIGPIQSTAEGNLVTLASLGEVDGTLPENLDLSFAASYGNLGVELAFDAPLETFSMFYNDNGGSIDGVFSSSGMSFGAAGSGATARVTGSDMPVPFEASVGSGELRYTIPLAASDAPQDMGLRIGIQDLVLGESLMSMFDPGRALPRTPSSLLFDATGQVQILLDLLNLDPTEMAAPPAELRALSVNELNLSVGGAALTGTADLTFAPNQLIPMPVGQVDLQLSGGNALLNSLVAGGLVPASQSPMIMGMASVFARPGAGPDTMETTIEFGPNGSISANGVPLQ